MWPLLDTALEPTMPLKDKVTYLSLINRNPELRFEKEKDIISLKDTIQELITSPISRCEGYLFMDALMKHHPAIYIHNWGPIVIGSLKCSDNYVSKQLTLRILNHVVVNFSGNSSCAEAFHRFIPEILPLLLEAEQNEEGFAYCCLALANCMQHMPAILGPHSDEIESFLMKNVDSLSHNIVEALADCFAAFPVCLGYFQKPKPSYVDVWLEVYLKTLNTLQALLNDLLEFPGGDDSFASVDDLSLFTITYDANEEFSNLLTKIRVFQSLCTCLAKLMSVRFESNTENTRVHVPVHDLLKCLERIFKVKEVTKGKQTLKCSIFLLAYPLIQDAASVVLKALIVNFSIIEQAGNFLKLMKESISFATLTSLTQSSSRLTRSTTWRTINIWLKQYGAKGSYEIVNDRFLIQELLKDIALESENGHSQTNGSMEIVPDTYREECCFEALQVLQNIFAAGGSYIDKGLADEISTTILKMARKIQMYLHPAKKFPHPYNNENCRLKLYDSLLSGSLFGDPLQTKHIKQAINVFKIALKDPNLEINTVCHKAFKLCRCLLNPKKLPPESLTCSDIGRALPPPQKENLQTGWESGNWNVNIESSLEEKSIEVAPPCKIETVFHNSVESEGQRDLLPVQNTKSPIHFSEAHESQCNGNNSRILSHKPSHSNICNDSGSDEIEEYKEYSMEDTHILLPVDIPPIVPPQSSVINSIDAQISEPKIINPEPKIIELKPLETVVPDSIATSNHHDSNLADSTMKSIDEEDEEMPQNQSSRRMTQNGMNIESDEEESGDEEDEEGTGSEEEEEANEAAADEYSPEFYPGGKEANNPPARSPGYYENREVSIPGRSPEYHHERPPKRRKMSNEEDNSSEEYEEERSQNQDMNQDEESEEEESDMPNRSPTVHEMCQDFVLAEPEEIS